MKARSTFGAIVVCLLAMCVGVMAAESPDYLAVKAAFDGSPTAQADAENLKRSVDSYQNIVPDLNTNDEVRAWLARRFMRKGWVVGSYPAIDDLFELRIPASDQALTEPDRLAIHKFLRAVENASADVFKGE